MESASGADSPGMGAPDALAIVALGVLELPTARAGQVTPGVRAGDRLDIPCRRPSCRPGAPASRPSAAPRRRNQWIVAAPAGGSSLGAAFTVTVVSEVSDFPGVPVSSVAVIL